MIPDLPERNVAVILSIVLHPVVILFVGLRINRILAIVITLIIAFLLVAALVGFFISQGTKFSESFPLLIDKLTQIINEIITCGLLAQAGIIAALYMTGLLLLGIEYAVRKIHCLNYP